MTVFHLQGENQRLLRELAARDEMIAKLRDEIERAHQETHAQAAETARCISERDRLFDDRDNAQFNGGDGRIIGAAGEAENRALRIRVEDLTRERDQALAAHRRVVANESNHYDRYWQPMPGTVTDEWLDATEAKMREALEDVFCDDAAAIMLTLIDEIRRAPSNAEKAK